MAGDRVFTIAESAIDALSHFAFFKSSNASYGAVGGGMKDNQFSCLMDTIQKMPNLEKIVLAVDHDQGGVKIATRIENYLSGKFTGEIIRHVPTDEGMDWNEVLKSQ